LAPTLNPIENAFSQLKAFFRKAAARTIEGLWKAIAHGMDTIGPIHCINYFVATCYEPT